MPAISASAMAATITPIEVLLVRTAGSRLILYAAMARPNHAAHLTRGNTEPAWKAEILWSGLTTTTKTSAAPQMNEPAQARHLPPAMKIAVNAGSARFTAHSVLMDQSGGLIA